MATNLERNKLPFDVRVSYNKFVDLYKEITHYELGFISEKEFIDNIRMIETNYENINENDPLLPPRFDKGLIEEFEITD